ncbi:hypothetical protein LMH87_001438 [Akanthomyces muscarius]|uniref:Uncharacterized protein n=1 Tax=Akanthomyces muscarius TaxID=2231603 RepID=A0A9W8Q4T3_AKAMU|nr:hypothetical protein LMH87_001438 [Akanthomyces muscarius]KAJ4146879.1 hypothetical protein LMH87_001438 [Akanthomyces muscarius]
MFSSRRTCLSSLTIPFEIMGEDFSQAADLLVQTSIEFLAIDISYCGLLADCFSPQPGSGVPMKTFENLRALAIYYSENDEDFDELYER